MHRLISNEIVNRKGIKNQQRAKRPLLSYILQSFSPRKAFPVSVLDVSYVLHHVEHKNDGHRVRVVAVLLHFGRGVAQRPPTKAVRRVVYRLATLLVRFLDVVLLGPVTVLVDLPKGRNV